MIMSPFFTTDLRASSSSSTVDTTKYQTEIATLKTALDKAKSENSSLEKTITSLNEQVASFKSNKDELNEKVGFPISYFIKGKNGCWFPFHIFVFIQRHALIYVYYNVNLNSLLLIVTFNLVLYHEIIIKSPHSFRK